jgi:hypothetical protein
MYPATAKAHQFGIDFVSNKEFRVYATDSIGFPALPGILPAVRSVVPFDKRSVYRFTGSRFCQKRSQKYKCSENEFFNHLYDPPIFPSSSDCAIAKLGGSRPGLIVWNGNAVFDEAGDILGRIGGMAQETSGLDPIGREFRIQNADTGDLEKLNFQARSGLEMQEKFSPVKARQQWLGRKESGSGEILGNFFGQPGQESIFLWMFADADSPDSPHLQAFQSQT